MGRGEPGAEESTPKPRPAWQRWLPLVVLAAVTVGIFATGAHRHISLETIVAHRKTLSGFIAERFVLALAAYMAIYVSVVALSLPGGSLMTLAGGFLFGWRIGGAAAVLAATVGATLLFVIARSAFGEALAARAGPQLARFSEGFRRDAASYMLFLRLVPIFPFWLVNLAPALLGVRLSTFAWTTLIGVVPATLAFAFAGAGLDSVIAAQAESFDQCVAAGRADCRLAFSAGALITRELLLAFGALGVVALIPVALKRFGWLGAAATPARKSGGAE